MTDMPDWMLYKLSQGSNDGLPISSPSIDIVPQPIGNAGIWEEEDIVIEVTNKVKAYEVDGKEPAPGEHSGVIIRSHWNYNDWIVIEMFGRRLSLNADDLQAAIQNATNVHRY